MVDSFAKSGYCTTARMLFAMIAMLALACEEAPPSAPASEAVVAEPIAEPGGRLSGCWVYPGDGSQASVCHFDYFSNIVSRQRDLQRYVEHSRAQFDYARPQLPGIARNLDSSIRVTDGTTASSVQPRAAQASAARDESLQRVGLPAAPPSAVGLSEAALQKIAPAMKQFVDSNRAAGVATAVARHGKLMHFEAVGTMDSARTVPMRPDAVFRIYSMTKPVTTVAIMQLQEQDKLRLSDPVSKYIPAFAETKVFGGGTSLAPVLVPLPRAITVADLLTHTAGLTYGSFGNSPVDSIYRRAALMNNARTVAQFADSIARLPLLFAPGTRWNYSMALDVLGRVVEVASGRPFDRYLQDEIFAPLKMGHTSFHATAAMEGNITWLFSAAGDWQLRPGTSLLSAGYRDGAQLFAGGQGLLSTIPDYLRFAQMLLNGGELDGQRILKGETVELMMRNHLPENLIPISLIRGHGFGYGGAVQVDSGTAYPAAPGTFRWSGYASTFFWIDPRHDMIGMVWTQVTPTLGDIEAAFQRVVYSAVVGK